jgi:hypothetical protein
MGHTSISTELITDHRVSGEWAPSRCNQCPTDPYRADFSTWSLPCACCASPTGRHVSDKHSADLGIWYWALTKCALVRHSAHTAHPRRPTNAPGVPAPAPAPARTRREACGRGLVTSWLMERTALAVATAAVMLRAGGLRAVFSVVCHLSQAIGPTLQVPSTTAHLDVICS